MSTAILEAPVMPESALTVYESLATATEKLAALRFFILLTARREALESAEPDAHEHLKSDLAWLRAQYFDMIDEIAMKHSVQAAMDAKQEVERGVTAPREWPPMDLGETEQAWF